MNITIRKAQPKLIVDGRMLFSSGIGRYLREILSRIPKDAPFPIDILCNTQIQRDWIERSAPSAVASSSREHLLVEGAAVGHSASDRCNLLGPPLQCAQALQLQASSHDSRRCTPCLA